jgi:hypothetical protein
MKIQLDFNKKTVVVDKAANLGDLVQKLQDLLHDWEEWSLLPVSKVEYLPTWNEPNIIPMTTREIAPYTSPSIAPGPPAGPNIICKSSMPTTGIYNLEIL